MTENIVDNFDLLMVAGDISNGDPAAVIDILNILGIDVILVRGNHDPLDLGDLGNIKELKYGERMQYNGISIMGLPYPVEDHTVVGSPEEEHLFHLMNGGVPDKILARAPPLGFYDWMLEDPDRQYGSPNLARYLEKNNPKLVICGHVHCFGGKISKFKDTLVANVSLLNSENKLKGGAWMEIEFEEFVTSTRKSLI